MPDGRAGPVSCRFVGNRQSAMLARSKRPQTGAAAVEFAILLPLLIVLVFGIWQFSMAYNRSQALNAGVREGARLAARGEADLTTIQARTTNAIQQAPGAGFDPGDLTITVRGFGSASDAEAQTSPVTVHTTGTDVPCSTDDYEVVRVDAYVFQNLERYAIQVPLLPLPSGAENVFDQDGARFAIFRCLP